MAKQYYFVRYQVSGKTYYKNQDGKRVSAEKVKSGKRKVYELVQREIKGSGGESLYKKGELLDRKKAKAKKVKEPENQRLPVQNIFIQREIISNQNKGRDIFTKVLGSTYKHESKESQANVILFNYEVNESFYRRLKKLIDSPVFVLDTIQSRKNNLFLIDYDSLQLDSGIKESKMILKAFIQFKNDVKQLRSKYFNK